MQYLWLFSMEFGGVLWFENLTMADPFYLLPLLTSCSLYLQGGRTFVSKTATVHRWQHLFQRVSNFFRAMNGLQGRILYQKKACGESYLLLL